MSFFKGTIFKVVLPLALVLSVFSGNVAQADGQPPTPATSQFVALNTYGSLPVVVLNLTLSSIDLSVSTTSPFYSNAAMPFPLAAGLPGVYFAGSNRFNNITTPNDQTKPSLKSPVVGYSIGNTIGNLTYSKANDWMSLFTLFPSWTAPVSISNQQYVSLNNFSNGAPLGAAAYSYNVVSGYPSGNGVNTNKSGDYTTAAVLDASQPTSTTINLALQNTGNPPGVPTYQIKISSLGAGTPGNVSEANSFSIIQAMHIAFDITADAITLSGEDIGGTIAIILGIASTMEGITASDSNSVNSYVSHSTTDKPYPAKSKGIQVSVSSNYPLSLTSGDSQSLMYSATPAANWEMPYLFNNAVFVTTFRQTGGNSGSGERNSADTLFVTVVNESIYAANQVQQYINSPNSASMAAGAKYKPTKAQAQDSLKMLTILTALSKDRPQDAKTIVDMFGVNGKYNSIKNDPNALRSLNASLKAILERYIKEEPDVVRYLENLARK